MFNTTVQEINSLNNLDDFYKVTKAVGLSIGKKVDYVQAPSFYTMVKGAEFELVTEYRQVRPYQYNYLGIIYLFYAHIDRDVIYILATRYSRKDIVYDIKIDIEKVEEEKIDYDYLNALIEVDEFLSGEYIDRELNIG